MKQPPIKVYPPGYAWGYQSANQMFKPMNRASLYTAVNLFQRREQAVMRMFDRTMEISA